MPDAITNGSVLATKGGCFALWFWLELPIVWNLSAACRSLGYAAIYNNCMIYVSIIYIGAADIEKLAIRFIPVP